MPLLGGPQLHDVHGRWSGSFALDRAASIVNILVRSLAWMI